MDRTAAFLILTLITIISLLAFLALFSRSPIFSSFTIALGYSLYLFVANEKAGVHNAQEFENRFWTVMSLMFSSVAMFAAGEFRSVSVSARLDAKLLAIHCYIHF